MTESVRECQIGRFLRANRSVGRVIVLCVCIGPVFSGFFPTYKAHANEALDRKTAEIWLKALIKLRKKEPIDPNSVAKGLSKIRVTDKKFLTKATLVKLGKQLDPEIAHTLFSLLEKNDENATLSRGETCELFYASLWN